MISKRPIPKTVILLQSEHDKQISKAQREIDIVCHALCKTNPDIPHITKALQEIELPRFKDKERDSFKAEARKELTLLSKQTDEQNEA
jgi:hypothetical protein